MYHICIGTIASQMPYINYLDRVVFGTILMLSVLALNLLLDVVECLILSKDKSSLIVQVSS